MSSDPKVIEPADYNLKKAAKKCGMHAGIFGCPMCREFYNDYGGMHVVECVKCQFVFPTDWWSVYSKGVNDGRRVAAGGPKSGGMNLRMENPYYRKGFETTEGEAYKTKDVHDWRVVTEGWKPSLCESDRMCSGICERCGKPKDESRKNRSGECIACQAETECKHRCSMMEKCCKAGVNFKELGDGKLGPGKSMPCYYVAGTVPIHCPKFEPKTVEECKARDREIELSMARFMLVEPLVRQIKETHKGKSWASVEECPVCKGKLFVVDGMKEEVRPLSGIAELMLAQTAVALTLTLHTDLMIDLKGCSPIVECCVACIIFPLVAVEGVLYLMLLGCFAGDRK